MLDCFATNHLKLMNVLVLVFFVFFCFFFNITLGLLDIDISFVYSTYRISYVPQHRHGQDKLQPENIQAEKATQHARYLILVQSQASIANAPFRPLRGMPFPFASHGPAKVSCCTYVEMAVHSRTVNLVAQTLKSICCTWKNSLCRCALNVNGELVLVY